ncbi:TPA: hypothetical protein ACRNWQ_006453, partial [Pseudomonas aeruginosa]
QPAYLLFPANFPFMKKRSKRPLRIMGADSRQKLGELACSDQGIVCRPDALPGSSYRVVG